MAATHLTDFQYALAALMRSEPFSEALAQDIFSAEEIAWATTLFKKTAGQHESLFLEAYLPPTVERMSDAGKQCFLRYMEYMELPANSKLIPKPLSALMHSHYASTLMTAYGMIKKERSVAPASAASTSAASSSASSASLSLTASSAKPPTAIGYNDQPDTSKQSLSKIQTIQATKLILGFLKMSSNRSITISDQKKLIAKFISQRLNRPFVSLGIVPLDPEQVIGEDHKIATEHQAAIQQLRLLIQQLHLASEQLRRIDAEAQGIDDIIPEIIGDKSVPSTKPITLSASRPAATSSLSSLTAATTRVTAAPISAPAAAPTPTAVAPASAASTSAASSSASDASTSSVASSTSVAIEQSASTRAPSGAATVAAAHVPVEDPKITPLRSKKIMEAIKNIKLMRGVVQRTLNRAKRHSHVDSMEVLEKPLEVLQSSFDADILALLKKVDDEFRTEYQQLINEMRAEYQQLMNEINKARDMFGRDKPMPTVIGDQDIPSASQSASSASTFSMPPSTGAATFSKYEEQRRQTKQAIEKITRFMEKHFALTDNVRGNVSAFITRFLKPLFLNCKPLDVNDPTITEEDREIADQYQAKWKELEALWRQANIPTPMPTIFDDGEYKIQQDAAALIGAAVATEHAAQPIPRAPRVTAAPIFAPAAAPTPIAVATPTSTASTVAAPVLMSRRARAVDTQAPSGEPKIEADSSSPTAAAPARTVRTATSEDNRNATTEVIKTIYETLENLSIARNAGVSLESQIPYVSVFITEVLNPMLTTVLPIGEEYQAHYHTGIDRVRDLYRQAHQINSMPEIVSARAAVAAGHAERLIPSAPRAPAVSLQGERKIAVDSSFAAVAPVQAASVSGARTSTSSSSTSSAASVGRSVIGDERKTKEDSAAAPLSEAAAAPTIMSEQDKYTQEATKLIYDRLEVINKFTITSQISNLNGFIARLNAVFKKYTHPDRTPYLVRPSPPGTSIGDEYLRAIDKIRAIYAADDNTSMPPIIGDEERAGKERQEQAMNDMLPKDGIEFPWTDEYIDTLEVSKLSPSRFIEKINQGYTPYCRHTMGDERVVLWRLHAPLRLGYRYRDTPLPTQANRSSARP